MVHVDVRIHAAVVADAANGEVVRVDVGLRRVDEVRVESGEVEERDARFGEKKETLVVHV